MKCCCDAEIEEITLPPDLARLSGKKTLWIHSVSREKNCYPDDPDCVATPEDEL